MRRPGSIRTRRENCPDRICEVLDKQQTAGGRIRSRNLCWSEKRVLFASRDPLSNTRKTRDEHKGHAERTDRQYSLHVITSIADVTRLYHNGLPYPQIRSSKE